ncbi:enolase C-terminal domain-like protein [Sinomonas atrocyanea]|uniref:enolase C-terminal domain-like protein n=1 Tax=Sinomonas atrocyanea TaxID=37927 RepID=UPI00285C2022|nr:enolase C-terminal domain-like protein [Sinomonas atrocyanea]MDR6622070.1 L-alanine-DL-glutamate epimerase-like enolase superfamily enzyme [Sinomonas atrocyanea]
MNASAGAPMHDAGSGAAVSSVTAAAYTVPTDEPEADGTFAWDSTTIVVVRVEAGGTHGTGYTYGPAALVPVVQELLSPAVVGADVFSVPACSEAMARALRNAGQSGACAYAASAVDCALWDAAARHAGLPLHQFLGAARTEVPVYGSGGFTTYTDARMAEQLTGWTAQGIPRVKIKIGQDRGASESRDLARMLAAREAIGARTALFVDANGAYTPKQAVRVADAAAEARITWFEEPVSSEDLDGLRFVRERTSPDVAAGEYLTRLKDAERMCAAGAVDCLQADVTRCGGITVWLRIAAVAAAHGVGFSGHCAPAISAAPAAAAPGLRHLEWFHDHVRLESMLFDGVPDPDGGAIAPDPSLLGNGLVLRSADAEQYRVA